MQHRTKRLLNCGNLAALLFLLVAFPLVGRSQTSLLKKLFSDYYEFQLRDSPEQATFVGRNEYNDRWDDPSPEHLRQYRKSLQTFLGRLKAIPEATLTGQDRLSYRLLDWLLKDGIEDTDLDAKRQHLRLQFGLLARRAKSDPAGVVAAQATAPEFSGEFDVIVEPHSMFAGDTLLNTSARGWESFGSDSISWPPRLRGASRPEARTRSHRPGAERLVNRKQRLLPSDVHHDRPGRRSTR